MMTRNRDTNYNQCTLANEIRCEGIGLHTGNQVHLVLKPAPENYGITYRRTDLPNSREIPAHSKYVVDTSLATTLGRDDYRVSTVEHLSAALHVMGIDNLRVEVDAPEIPVFDGSALPFVHLIQKVGLVKQRAMKRFLVIKKTVTVEENGKVATLRPANSFSLSCRIDFKHPLISNQSIDLECDSFHFCREIACARTFGFLTDIEMLQKAGLAKGGSVDNAIVVDGFNVLNPDGLRFADEFVRHKALDAVGDVFMFGHPLIGHLDLFKSGHALNHLLVEKVLSDASNYEVVRAIPSELTWINSLPSFARPVESLAC